MQTERVLASLGLTEYEIKVCIWNVLFLGGGCDCQMMYKLFLPFDKAHAHARIHKNIEYPARLHPWMCSKCGKECYLRFIPDPNRPVYCREFWEMKKHSEGAKICAQLYQHIELMRRYREHKAFLEEKRRRNRIVR